MQYWEVIADKLHATGWSWRYCSAVTRDGWRWIVDARFLNALTKVPYTAVVSAGKSAFDYVTRRFNLSSARLNTPQGLGVG